MFQKLLLTEDTNIQDENNTTGMPQSHWETLLCIGITLTKNRHYDWKWKLNNNKLAYMGKC
jgi:hypothetical protein